MTATPSLALLDRVAIQIATAFGIGRAPKAPGTFGSLPGLAVGAGINWVASRSFGAGTLEFHGTLAISLVMVSALAYWSIDRMETALAVHDDQSIVIDEVAGQAIAAAWMPIDWAPYFVAFLLFRLFDITKPGPIGKIDRDAPGAWGTLGDDLLAGVVAAIVGSTLAYALPV
ncbi:MAG: phosphatidylglycerophosphatase A [Deltaproteobacteria bacterium]|nr:phosphatidylglycerophosphatase A [Deltaproteobacteria bacterium]